MGGLRGPARGWTVNIRATGEIWSGVVATFNTVPAGWGMLAGAGDLDFPVRGGADSHRYGLIFSIDEGATWAYAGANHTFTLPPGDPVPRRVCLAVNRPHLDETAAGTGAWTVTITGSVPDAGDIPMNCAANPPPTGACTSTLAEATMLRDQMGDEASTITNAHSAETNWTNALVAAIVAFGVLATIEGALLAAGVAAQASIGAAETTAAGGDSAVAHAIDAAIAAGVPGVIVGIAGFTAAAVGEVSTAVGILSAGLAAQAPAMPWWITLGLVIGLALLLIALGVIVAAIAEMGSWGGILDDSISAFADLRRELSGVLSRATEFCCPGTFDQTVPVIPNM